MTKKRILILPTWPGWSFDNTANAIIKNLNEYYHFDKIFHDPEEGYEAEFDHEKFDLIHCMWWYNDLPQKYNIPKEKLIVGLYSFYAIPQKLL